MPDSVRVLLVEAESKLMELKYRGARASGASDGAGDLLGVSVLRADTHGDLMSVREAVDTTSKAFATGGEDFAYYLNESRAVARSGLGAAAAAGENWADSSPLHHHSDCCALAPLHAGCRKHEKPPGTCFAGGDANELALATT